MWVIWAVIAGAASPGSLADDRAADRTALERIARGDQDGLSALYDRHARPVYSLAFRILQDQGEAEDIVQEVFQAVGPVGPVRRITRARGGVVVHADAEPRDRSAAGSPCPSRARRRRASDGEPRRSRGLAGSAAAVGRTDRPRARGARVTAGPSARRDRARVLRRPDARGSRRAAGTAARHNQDPYRLALGKLRDSLAGTI